MKTPLRYAGGKSKAYKIITKELVSFSPKKVVSPFLGGGSLEVRWSSELDLKVEGYDIFYALTNFWNVLLNKRDDLILELKKLTPTKDEYVRIKNLLLSWDFTQDLLKNWNTSYYKRTPITLTDVEAAAYYYHNHNLSYGPMYLGWISKIYEEPKKWNSMIDKISKFENKNLSVSCDIFQNVIPNNKDEFLYLDPPYLLSEDKDNKMFKGIYPNANIDIHHTGFEHEKLRDLLHSHQGKFIVSYNDCEKIREWYKDFELQYPKWHYSYALGETRIGKNKEDNSPKESHEILIIKR